jgi:hypothetical protein
METGETRWADWPYLDEPGCCPRCGIQLRPQADAVLAGGSWSKSGLWGLPVTGGHVFECQCPRCQATLLSFPDGWPRWEDMDPSQVRWSPPDA